MSTGTAGRRSAPASRSTSASRTPGRTGNSQSGTVRGSKERGSRRGLWLWAAAGAAVLVLASVVVQRGQGSASDQTGRTATGVSVTRPGGGRVGDTAPQFTTGTTTGTTFALPAGKPAVVFFMAGWCGSCFPEAQALAAVNKQMGDKVAILAVSPDPSDSIGALKDFAKQAGASYGFAHDNTGALAQALGVRSLDTTVVTDSAGKIVFRDGVPTDEATLRSALTKAGAA